MRKPIDKEKEWMEWIVPKSEMEEARRHSEESTSKKTRGIEKPPNL